MKKLYFLLAAFLFINVTSNAQTLISDNFESYTLGDMGSQASWWNAWSGTPNSIEDIQVVNDFSNSASQSGYIGAGVLQDALLILGNLTSGVYTLTFYMRVSQNSSAYFNIQGELTGTAANGFKNSGDIFFNESGTTPGEGVDQADGSTFTYPEDTFFPVSLFFDLDSTIKTYTLYVNGNLVSFSPIAFQTDSTLGAIDFYAALPNNEYWIDDVTFEIGNTLNTTNFSTNEFSVYPNPVNDVLNIKSAAAVTSVTVYDMLGKIVLNTEPNTISPKVTMNSLTSGIYLVKVTIGKNTKIIKIIK